MTISRKAVEAWYAGRLREYLLAYSRASAAFDRREGGDPEVVCPRKAELSPSGERADIDKVPQAVREAYEFYKQNIQDADIGWVAVYSVSADGEQTYAIRVRTDGDDGFLEVYDAQGNLLAAGRTYLEIVAWGSQDWLRAQVQSPWERPPELRDAHEKTLWGKDLPD